MFPQPKVEELTETAAKEKLVAAVNASFDFCGTALGQSGRREARRPHPGLRRQDPATRLGGAGSRRKLVRSLRRSRDVSPAERPAAADRAKEAGRTQEMTVERPAGVTAVAAAFLLAGAYLLIVGLTMLARPGLVSDGGGCRVARRTGTRRSLHVSACWWAGRCDRARAMAPAPWARWLAILAPLIGVVHAAARCLQRDVGFPMGKLVWAGLGTIVRVMIVWYLFQEPVGRLALQRLLPKSIRLQASAANLPKSRSSLSP